MSHRSTLCIAVASALLTSVAHADGASQGTAADVLMRSVSAAPGAAPAPGLVTLESTDFKLDDPFLMAFFAEWRGEKSLSFDTNLWAQGILRGQIERSAHVWSVVEKSLPETFRISAETAHLYSLWKLGLSQHFFDQWVQRLSQPGFLQSRAALAFQQVIQPRLDQWLLDQAIQVSPEQSAILSKLPASFPGALSLQAYASLRKGEAAVAMLPQLPASHALKLPLSQTAALHFARKGDLASAARVLKGHAEPAIEAGRSTGPLASHWLQIARLLYQAGALQESQQYYEKVPRSAPEFLTAREELTWVLLRQGDAEKLRGELKTLASPLFAERFQPESYVVRAISDLKLCRYQDVEQEFSRFLKQFQPVARKIDEALKQSDPAQPFQLDLYSRQAGERVRVREAELASIEELHRRSVAASLPAVGFQSQWVRARESIVSQIEAAKKIRSAEYRRQWRNDQLLLEEAIRKMQFVKLELLNQVRETQRLGASQGDAIRVTSAAPSRDSTLRSGEGQMVFPFDQVYWPDELFHLRSLSAGKCLR